MEEEPKNPPDSREPTTDELLAEMHADELPFWKSGDGSPRQRDEFLEGIKARWRAKQEPDTQPNPEPPESKPDENTPVNKIPFPNPTEEYLRQERIWQAYASGQRPDPEDLAEEEVDRLRHQREVAEALERKLKTLSSPEPPESKPNDSEEESDTMRHARAVLEDAEKRLKEARSPLPPPRIHIPEEAPPKFQLIGAGEQSKTSPPPDESEQPSESHHIRISRGVGTFLLSAGFVSVIGLVIGAFQLAGVVNMSLAHMVMALAWVVSVFAIWLWLLSRPQKHTFKVVLLTACFLAIVFFAIDRYMVWLKSEQERVVTQPSPSPTPTPYAPVSIPVMSPQVLPTQQASPTPFPTPSPITQTVNFNRRIPLKGGSRQRLSDVLREGGYVGPVLLQELTIRNPDSNEGTIYYGQSDVNETNGNPLEQGSSYTWRVGGQQDIIDTTQIYLLTSKNGTIGITLRSVAR